MKNLADYLEGLAREGAHDSEGHFTLSLSEGLAKMLAYGQEDPLRFALRLVQFGQLEKAQAIHFFEEAMWTCVSWDGPVLTEPRLRAMADQLQRLEFHRCPLTQAVAMALATRPDKLLLESSSTRLILENGQVTVGGLLLSPGWPENRLVLAYPPQIRRRKNGLQQLLRDHCWFSRIEVLYNQSRVDRPAIGPRRLPAIFEKMVTWAGPRPPAHRLEWVYPGSGLVVAPQTRASVRELRPRLGGASVTVAPDEGLECDTVLVFREARAQSLWIRVVDTGVVVAEVGDGDGDGLAVVCRPGLRYDLSGFSLVKDAAWSRLAAELESELVLIGQRWAELQAS